MRHTVCDLFFLWYGTILPFDQYSCIATAAIKHKQIRISVCIWIRCLTFIFIDIFFSEFRPAVAHFGRIDWSYPMHYWSFHGYAVIGLPDDLLNIKSIIQRVQKGVPPPRTFGNFRIRRNSFQNLFLILQNINCDAEYKNGSTVDSNKAKLISKYIGNSIFIFGIYHVFNLSLK